MSFHQTNATNHLSIRRHGLCPGGPAKYNSGDERHKRWCVYASLADGHGIMPNFTMIDGQPAVPYKFRDHGIVYCLSTYYITVTMGIEIWRTEAWCAMIMGWVSPNAIPYSFDCCNGECWHQDRLRHDMLASQCHDCHTEHLKAIEEKQEKERTRAAKRGAADAAAPKDKRRKLAPHLQKGSTSILPDGVRKGILRANMIKLRSASPLWATRINA